MASRVKITNRMPQFSRKVHNVMGDAIKEAARDTLIKARQKAPFDKGGLRSESDIRSEGPLGRRVVFWKEYARFQEFGGDSKRRVRHYSTPGTGKHFLRDAGDEQSKKLNAIFKKHSRRVRV